MPDLVTTAKGIAGGMPLAGVTGRAELLDVVHGGGLGGTYGGNPVACASALATIDVMRHQDLAGAARHIGDTVLGRLRELAAEIPVVGDVRGRGAMCAAGAGAAGHARTRRRSGRGRCNRLPRRRGGGPHVRHVRQRRPAAAAAGDRGRPAGRRARCPGRCAQDIPVGAAAGA